MVTYPASPRISIESSGETIREASRSESDAAYIMTRPKYTRKRESFNLVYTNILVTDYLILKNFFTTYQGQSFTYTSVVDGLDYEVVFNMDKIPFKLSGAGRCSTSVALIEV